MAVLGPMGPMRPVPLHVFEDEKIAQIKEGAVVNAQTSFRCPSHPPRRPRSWTCTQHNPIRRKNPRRLP